MTPGSEAITRTLSVDGNDFLCNRQSILWLLGFKKFYNACPTFRPLWSHARGVSAFIKKHGLGGGKGKPGCRNCQAAHASKAQVLLVDNFAKIFIYLHEADRMEELRQLMVFASTMRKRSYKRVILAYAGKATKNKERLLVVD